MGYKYPKLSELCAFFNVTDAEISKKSEELFGSLSNYHDARFDTTAVYLAMNTAVKTCQNLEKLKDYYVKN